MAIQDLEVVVTVNVQKALRALRDLENGLESVADKIDKVDRRGSTGVNVSTNVQSIQPQLRSLRRDIESWEARNEIDIRTDTGGLDLTDLDDIHIRDERGGLGGRDTDVATMNVDAGVVNLQGLSLDHLQERLRNGTREGMIDAMQSEEITAFFSGPRREEPDDDDEDVSFRRRMRRVRMDFSAGDLGVGGALSEVSDELGKVAANSKLTNLSMSDLHNAFARVIPLLITFIGTLPALIGALVTLYAATIAAAGALAALTGLGAIGFAMEDGTTNLDTERFTQMLQNLRDQFLEAFAPIAQRLEPLFRDGLDGLQMFFNELAQEGDALIALTDEARAFGGFIIDFVPSALRDLAAMVSALSDSFGGIGQFLMNNFTTIIRGMVDTFVQSLPAIAELLSLIAAMIPPLIRMSVGFVRVTSAVFMFFGAIGDLIGVLGINAELLGVIIGSALTLASAWLLLVGVAKTLGATLLAYAVRPLQGYIFNAIVASISSYALANSIAFLLSIVTLGAFVALAAGVAHFGTEALNTKSKVDQLNDSLRTFDSLSSGMGGGFGNPSGGSPSAASAVPSESGGGGMSMTYNDYGGDGNPDQANAYSQWRYERTTGDRA